MCSLADARARLTDAGSFLRAAELLDDPDVVATNAVIAAIAASDAICCVALGARAADLRAVLRVARLLVEEARVRLTSA